MRAPISAGTDARTEDQKAADLSSVAAKMDEAAAAAVVRLADFQAATAARRAAHAAKYSI